MNKFTALASALILGGMGFAANAQLGQPYLETTKYSTILDYNFYVTWSGSEIEFVDPANTNVKIYAPGDETAYEVPCELYGGVDMSEEGEFTTGTALMTLNGENDDFASKYLWAWPVVDGTYRIEVPAGLVRSASNQEENEAVTLDYVVYPGVTGIYPVTNISLASTVYDDIIPSYQPSELSEVTLTWPSNLGTLEINPDVQDGMSVQAYEWVDYPWGGGGYDPVGDPIEIPYALNADKTSLVINLSNLKEGLYQINMPGSFLIFNGDKVLLSTPEYAFRIFSGMESAEVLMPSVPVTSILTPIEFTWDYQVITPQGGSMSNLYGITLNSTAIPASAVSLKYVEKPSDEPSEPNQDPGDQPVPAAEQYNVLVVNLEGIVTEYGTYSLVLPQGLVYSGDLANPQQVYTFSYYAMGDQAEITAVEPASIQITYPDVLADYNTKYTNAFIVDAQGERMAEIDVIEFDGNTGMINLLPYKLADGSYSLILTEGCVWLTNNQEAISINPEQYFEFIMENGMISESGTTAVNAIGSEFNGVYTVYNLQGVKVLETRDASKLSNLKGIYIVNGKKAVLK